MAEHERTPNGAFKVAGDERGAVLVLVAVVAVALFGMAALAVDVGMGYTAKVEAQRAADSGALAGGSAFLEYEAAQAVPWAEARAYEYALRNEIRNIGIDSSEVTVQVLPDSFKVRVWVQRQSIGTWFARLIGFDQLTVLGMAAAQVTPAGAATCLKPFAVPDLWFDNDDDNVIPNNRWDEGEEWEFGSDPLDYYAPYAGEGTEGTTTGYGSSLRGPDQDYGTQIFLKMPDPNSEYVPSPGVFLPWRIPIDEDQEPCDLGGGGSGQDSGGAVYRQNICSCNNSAIDLDSEYEIEPGNMIGPTAQGIDELISEDPGAYWNEGTNTIEGSSFADAMSSPRVVKIALFAPGEIDGSGMQTIQFNNFALMFIEDQGSRQDPVTARFLYFASGQDSPGPTTGSLVRYLRLVE